MSSAQGATGTRKRRTGTRAPIAGLDHCIVGVRDLKQSAIAWRRLGFKLTPRGRHVGWGTANHCIMFLRSYVELLGIVDPAQFTNDLDRFLASREGLLSLAFGTTDADATAAALGRAGIAVEPPRTLSRVLEVADDDVAPRFRLVMLPPGATPGMSAFVCQHLTPELIRWPAWLTHPNGAVSLKGLAAVVDNPRALVPAYERLFGAGALTMGDGVLHIRAGRGRLSFATPKALAAMHPGVTLPAVAPPFLAAMTVGVARLADTAQYFDDFGVPCAVARDGTVRLDPKDASGVIVAFEAA